MKKIPEIKLPQTSGKKETVGKTSEGEEEDSSESGKDRIRHKLGV